MLSDSPPRSCFSNLLLIMPELLCLCSFLLLSRLIIGFVDANANGLQETWKGYFYAFLMFFAMLMQSVLVNWYMYNSFCMGMRAKGERRQISKSYLIHLILHLINLLLLTRKPQIFLQCFSGMPYRCHHCFYLSEDSAHHQCCQTSE